MGAGARVCFIDTVHLALNGRSAKQHLELRDTSEICLSISVRAAT